MTFSRTPDQPVVVDGPAPSTAVPRPLTGIEDSGVARTATDQMEADPPRDLDGRGGGTTQVFCSVLSEQSESEPLVPGAAMPSCFTDLNLDQIVDAVTAGHAEYTLAQLYYSSLESVGAVRYRQAVAQDVDGTPVRAVLETFAAQLRDMRRHLTQADELRHPYQRERWFADAVQIYCRAVSQLTEQLAAGDLTSAGFQAFRRYLSTYAASGEFKALSTAATSLQDALARVRYCLNIRGSKVTVTRYDAEADYSAAVEATFARFRQGEVNNYLVKFYIYADMNHVEANVLELVAKLYPETFLELDRFSRQWRDFQEPTLARFDREIQFYLAYFTYLDRVRRSGLQLCYPTVTDQGRQVSANNTFDLALADKLTGGKTPVISNDIDMTDPERIMVVSGPNQGGKTTLARTFGQIHFLAALGLPVPGTAATLPLFDEIFTHFEREESLDTLRGKLQDDLIRIHDILTAATGNSILIMNELFTSTTLQDAVFLGTEIVQQIIDLDALCVYVTFVDELSMLGPTTVSMVSTVEPEHPQERTYKICKRPADGQAHAIAIADKYGLTYPQLKERLGS